MNRPSSEIFIAVCALLASSSSYAAWQLNKEGTLTGKEYISDAEHKFSLGGMSCTVGPTEFLRAPDDSVMEYRELYCWVGSDTKVSFTANCNLPLYETSQMSIEKAGKRYHPTLTCGPKK